MPKPLTELFSEENLEGTLKKSHQKSETAFDELTISTKEAETVEEATRDKGYSNVWVEQRARASDSSKV